MSNSRIIKNTFFLSIRMFVATIIALYTSRLLLQLLGVEDFGIYNIIGGIVAMFSSLRGLFATSVQRFLNYEMGLNKIKELNNIFNMSIIIHIFICIIFILLAEVIGLWFITNKLVFDPERTSAVLFVFHFSVLSAVITILTIPYDAVLIARERMNIFAYIYILDTLLKLGIIFILPLFSFDSLKLYSILILCTSIIIRVINIFYCKTKFEECKFMFFWDRHLFKKLYKFAGWNFLGITAFSIQNEGSNILLNIFGGPAVNAARGLAYQVRGVVTAFFGNIQTSTNPRIVKLYAQDKKKELSNLLFIVSKISFFLSLIIGIPVIIFTKDILNIWLTMIPKYTISFIQFIIIYQFIRVFHTPLDSLFKATGNIKMYQIVESFILFLNLPISYLLLMQGLPLEFVFIVMIMIEFVNLFVILIMLNRKREIDIIAYFKKVLYPCSQILLISGSLSYFIFYKLEIHGFLYFILYLFLCLLTILIPIWVIGLNGSEKKTIHNFTRKIYLKYKT